MSRPVSTPLTCGEPRVRPEPGHVGHAVRVQWQFTRHAAPAVATHWETRWPINLKQHRPIRSWGLEWCSALKWAMFRGGWDGDRGVGSRGRVFHRPPTGALTDSGDRARGRPVENAPAEHVGGSWQMGPGAPPTQHRPIQPGDAGLWLIGAMFRSEGAGMGSRGGRGSRRPASRPGPGRRAGASGRRCRVARVFPARFRPKNCGYIQ